MNITVSHPGVNEISNSDFHRTVLPRVATFDVRNGPVAPTSDPGTCGLVVAKKGTGANTTWSPATETKVEGVEIDSEFSHLSNDYTIQ